MNYKLILYFWDIEVVQELLCRSFVSFSLSLQMFKGKDCQGGIQLVSKSAASMRQCALRSGAPSNSSGTQIADGAQPVVYLRPEASAGA